MSARSTSSTGSSTGCWAVKCKKCGHRYTWEGPMVPEPECPKCNPHLAETTNQQRNREGGPEQISPAVHKCIEQCDEILRMCRDIPEAGESFAESVAEKVEGIRDTISERGFVTENQREALNNMEDGLSRWFHD